MFEQAAAGQTPAEIADGANANGWRTKKTTARRTGRTRGGNLWTARQVITTLRNPVYLGLFREKAPFDELHDTMLAITPRGQELEFHVNLLRHGRRTCHARRPQCDECGLLKLCPTGYNLRQAD